MAKTKKVIVNGEELVPSKKVKLWEQDGYNRKKVRDLIAETRETAKREDDEGTGP